MKIRPAKLADAHEIHRLVKQHAQQGELLPRPLSEIYEKIPQFLVMQDGSTVVGCGALQVIDAGLAEVRTLIVRPGYQGKGIGAKIVAALEANARVLGLPKIFALSFKPGFFRKIGYGELPKEQLPQKIWRDCVKCPLFPDCGETALIKSLARRPS